MVHRLGFGAMRITGKGVWGPPADPAGAVRLLRHVVEAGVDFIDTADSYGPNVSEELIAEALHPYPAGLVIATKGGNVRPGPSHLYQLHRIDSKVPFDEQIGALADLRAEGKIRHIGLSNVSVAQLERARTIVDIVSVQNRYNLADRESDDVVDACQEHGLAFIPYFPIDAGDLATPGGRLDRIAAAHEATQAQIALAWLLHRSPVITPIPGTSSQAHFDENLAAAGIALTDAEYASL